MTHPRRTLSHDNLVRAVFQKTRDRGNYDKLYTHQEYGRNGWCGEFDVLAIRGKTAVMYEIKTSDTKRSRDKFFLQTARAKLAFPEYNWKFVYITNQCVKRYR